MRRAYAYGPIFSRGGCWAIVAREIFRQRRKTAYL